MFNIIQYASLNIHIFATCQMADRFSNNFSTLTKLHSQPDINIRLYDIISVPQFWCKELWKRKIDVVIFTMNRDYHPRLHYSCSLWKCQVLRVTEKKRPFLFLRCWKERKENLLCFLLFPITPSPPHILYYKN